MQILRQPFCVYYVLLTVDNDAMIISKRLPVLSHIFIFGFLLVTKILNNKTRSLSLEKLFKMKNVLMDFHSVSFTCFGNEFEMQRTDRVSRTYSQGFLRDLH